jgi:hypothetical protein
MLGSVLYRWLAQFIKFLNKGTVCISNRIFELEGI